MMPMIWKECNEVEREKEGRESEREKFGNLKGISLIFMCKYFLFDLNVLTDLGIRKKIQRNCQDHIYIVSIAEEFESLIESC